MSGQRPRLAFVSPLFLFPNDTGGKIRSTNILRGLKGGAFEVTLLSPARPGQEGDWAAQLPEVCDRFIAWRPPAPPPRWRRAFDLLGTLPVNVAADRRPPALRAVRQALAEQTFDVVVFDFVHAAVLKPARVDAATVCFTHNLEAEIFQRHAAQAKNGLMRWVWRDQHMKMRRFEGRALAGFDAVIAVSERDAQQFREGYGLRNTATIPTGVDFDFFAWQAPPHAGEGGAPTAVFTGSMDWAANIDGIGFFLDEVWPLVLGQLPEARFVVVGRDPPASLLERGRRLAGVSFTGFVDDVRPHVHSAQAFVIPLRVGGGTRIKAFEAMAMGCPVVSTSIGVEGLEVVPEEHYLRRDGAADMAAALVRLLGDADLRERLSRRARRCVEERFGHRVAARAFEAACLRALERRGAARAVPAPPGAPRSQQFAPPP